MNIISFQVAEIYDEISNEGLGYENALSLIRGKAEYFDPKDRMPFLSELVNKFQKDYDEHLEKCKAEDPRECTTSQWNIPFLHFLNQDIKSLEQEIATAVPDDSNFSTEERKKANERLDEIMSELEKLKVGQEVIWTDIMEELNEMKDRFFLSKKNWRQLLTGKLSEMVIAGVISETISKGIVDSINPITENLLA